MSVSTSQEPATSSAEPGESGAVHTVRVRNTGETVEEYHLSVVGPLARWATVEPEQVRLYPGADSSATVTFSVPRDTAALAGPTPFGVRVVPRVHPELADVAEGSIMVGAFGEMAAYLSPVTVRGRGSAGVRVTVENRGNAPLDVWLAGRDERENLVFTPQSRPFRVPPGSTGTPVLQARARRRRLVGGEQQYPFSLMVTPTQDGQAAGARPVPLNGTFVRLGMIPGWVLAVSALLLVLIVVLGSIAVVQGFSLSDVFGSSTSDDQGSRGDGAPPPDQDQGRNQGDGAVAITHDGRVLTADSGDDTAVVTRQPGSGSADRQRWTLRRTRSGSIVIVAGFDDGRALDERNGSGDPVALGGFDGARASGSQAWTLRRAGNDGVTIVNAATGDCLTDAGDGEAVTAARCGDDSSQTWTFDGV